jgi:hypothetical protein
MSNVPTYPCKLKERRYDGSADVPSAFRAPGDRWPTLDIGAPTAQADGTSALPADWVLLRFRLIEIVLAQLAIERRASDAESFSSAA